MKNKRKNTFSTAHDESTNIVEQTEKLIPGVLFPFYFYLYIFIYILYCTYPHHA